MILVVGATGSLGGKIVQRLLENGESVRALVRPASDPTLLERAGARVVRGDLEDPASLDRACAGTRAIVTTASVSRRGEGRVESVDLQGNLDLVAAAERAGVGHFVFVSTLGASPDSPVPVFRAKGIVEERLRGSAMTHTILRANAFMDVWFPMMVEGPALSGQPVTLVGESRRRHAFIAERDVAAFAVAALANPAARNATLVLGGPEAVGFPEVVRVYAAAAGRPIETRNVAPGDPIPGLPEPVWGIAAALETFDSPVPMAETAGRYGVALTSAREFAEARLATTV